MGQNGAGMCASGSENMNGLVKTALAFLCTALSVQAQIIAYAPSVADLQALIDGGAAYVVIRNPTPGQPYVQETPKTIMLRSNLTVICEPGVVIQAAVGAFKTAADVPEASLVSATSVDGLTIQGCTFRMRRAEYTVANGYPAAEWRHALSLKGCKNVQLSDLRLAESGGDGIYIGPSIAADGTRKPCENITLDRVICERNYRQGMSVLSVKGLTVRDSQFNETQGTAPQAGIDIEPASPLDVIQNVVIERCSARNNGGCAFVCYLARLLPTSAPVSITFRACNGSGIPIAKQLIQVGDFARNRPDNPPGTIAWDASVWP